MENAPPEEKRELNISQLDLETLYAIRDKISVAASGRASEIMTGITTTAIPEEIEDERIRGYIAAIQRENAADGHLAAAHALDELAMEVDEMIAKKEDDEELGRY